MRDLETIIYTALGALVAGGNTYMAFKSAKSWESLGDITGLYWLEIIFAGMIGGLVALKAKLSDPPTKEEVKESAKQDFVKVGNRLYKRVNQ